MEEVALRLGGSIAGGLEKASKTVAGGGEVSGAANRRGSQAPGSIDGELRRIEISFVEDKAEDCL
jgi:hypothetical protein